MKCVVNHRLTAMEKHAEVGVGAMDFLMEGVFSPSLPIPTSPTDLEQMSSLVLSSSTLGFVMKVGGIVGVRPYQFGGLHP